MRAHGIDHSKKLGSSREIAAAWISWWQGESKKEDMYIYMYRPLVLFSDKSERNTRYEG